jgi:hypothetical protein
MILLLLLTLTADPWADGSPFVEYGEGAGYGQSFYPDNILGPPDPEATPQSPAVGEDELLTLGKDGMVVLEFIDNAIVDGEGPDFTVFENVMQTGAGYFRECALVEVSQNGDYWVMFPWNSETLEGLAGVWPTTGDDPTDPSVSGGDQFDLADLGLEWVRFVRLTDCGDAVVDGGLFDLDAVAAVNSTTGITSSAGPPAGLRVSSPFTSSFQVACEEGGTLLCYTLDGRLAGQWQIDAGSLPVNSSALPPGFLLFRLGEASAAAVKISD